MPKFYTEREIKRRFGDIFSKNCSEKLPLRLCASAGKNL